jgi:sulfofructose kinase
LEASLAALKAFPRASSILDAGSLREGTAALAGKVKYLVASEKFALQVSKLKGLKSQRERRLCLSRLKNRYCNIVVVTLGERGLVADNGEGYLEMSAFKTTPVDTTAAGDIFHGAFAYGLARGIGFLEVLRFASMAAALSVTKKGGRPSIPTLAHVKKALAHAH